MTKVTPLLYWIDNKREIPIIKSNKNNKPNFEFGFFLALDISIPLYRVLEIRNQSLEESWNITHDYINKSIDIIENEYKEDVYYLKNGNIDIDGEQAYEIMSELGYPPSHCYPIYIVTVGSGSSEKLVYIGKTSSKKNRFTNGHRVALELHNPKYNSLEKNIYFGCIMFLTDEKEYLPLEWIYPMEDSLSLLDSIESGLIYHFKPELNTQKINKNYSKIEICLNIENHTGNSEFLNGEQVAL